MARIRRFFSALFFFKSNLYTSGFKIIYNFRVHEQGQNIQEGIIQPSTYIKIEWKGGFL